MPRKPQDDRDDALLSPDRRGEAADYRSARTRTRRRNPLKTLLPVLILAAFAVIVARQEVPAFATWWERTFTPLQWQRKETCRQAALAELQGGQYARQLASGVVHDTQDGPYVSNLRFSVLGGNGDERVVEFNCYLDQQGGVYRLTRVPE